MSKKSKMLEEVERTRVRARKKAPSCPQEPKSFVGLAGERRTMDPATSEKLEMMKRTTAAPLMFVIMVPICRSFWNRWLEAAFGICLESNVLALESVVDSCTWR